MYSIRSFPIVGRTSVSLYIEVEESEGIWQNINLGQVSDKDPRIDKHEIWTAKWGSKIYIFNCIET